MRASAGRLGGLAIALGVGTAALTAPSAFAAPADSPREPAAESASSAPVGSASAAPATPRSAARPQRSRSANPAAAQDRSHRSARTRAEAGRVSSPASAATAVAGVAPQSLPGADLPGTPARLTAPAALAAAPEPSGAAVATAVITSVPDTSTAEGRPGSPPVLTPQPAAAVALVDSVLSPLAGSGPGSPVQSPVSWMVLGVARRQLGRARTALAPTGTAVAAAATNQPPVINSVTLSTPNSGTGAVTGTVKASDSTLGKLSYAATTTTANGTVTITAAGVFTYTPTAAARHAAAKIGAPATVTSDTVTVTVTDARGAKTTKAVTVPIAPGNSAPVPTTTVGIPNATTGVITGSVSATDANQDTLTYSGSATTAKGSVTVNATTGAFTYTPTATARHAAAKIGASTAVTTDAFAVTVSDGYGATLSVPVSVTVSPQNTAPIAGTPVVGTLNSSTGIIAGIIKATDAESDTLTFTAPTAPTKGTVTVNAGTGEFTYTPDTTVRTTTQTDNFSVTVVDGYGGSTAIPVTVSLPGKSSLTFVFNYGTGSKYWSTASRDALQSAANTLASYFVVTTPVTLVFDVSATNSPRSSTMASTGSDLISGANGFFNTVVQNKILTGVDSNGAAADGTVDVNFGLSWSFGNSVSSSQYDFTSTAMHELLHAFGFLSYVDQPGKNNYQNWTKFDSMIVTSSGVKAINPNFKWNTNFNRNLTGANGGLYFAGTNAVAAYGGLVPLYTPKRWEAGSSVSHLDDNTFIGAAAKLMNAVTDTGLGIRVLSPVEIGVLKDIGYTMVTPAPGTATLLFFGLVVFRRRRR